MTRAKRATGRRFVVGAPETTTRRPDVYLALTERLLAEGWRYDRAVGEWVAPGADGFGLPPEMRGRIAWSNDGTRAWLRHPYGPGAVVAVTAAESDVPPPETHLTTEADVHRCTECGHIGYRAHDHDEQEVSR